MINEVRIVFDAYLDEKWREKPAIHKYLKEHERKERVLEKTCEQIRLAELSNIGRRFDVFKYRTFVRQCADIFCNAAIKHAYEQALSYAEKQRLIHEADHIKRCEEAMIDLENEALSGKLVSTPGSVAQ